MKKLIILPLVVAALAVVGALSLKSSQTVIQPPAVGEVEPYQASIETVIAPTATVPFATLTTATSSAEAVSSTIPSPSIELVPGGGVSQGNTLRIILKHYPVKPTLKFGDKPYSLFKYGGDWNALIPLGVDALTGMAKLTVGSTTESVAIEPAHFNVVTIALPDLLTTPQEIATYEAERKTILTAYGASVPSAQFAKPFGEPLDDITVTNPFGVTYVDPSDHKRTFHNGIDLRAAVGTPVKAVNDGVVKIAADYLLEGNFVMLDHGFGIFSDYLHLSKILVSPGERVTKGQVIGLSGESGEAVGPHLHFIIKVDDVPVAPLAFIGLWR